jgi:chemotaxis protein methyltransferase CheR
VTDLECVALLQEYLPRLGLRWQGFKNVRRQVCRRLAARTKELGLDASGYRARLDADEGERRALYGLCYVTISRFYRDRRTCDELRDQLLPELASRSRSNAGGILRVWSAGCASGEEPYTVAILWHLAVAPRFPDVTLEVLASDFEETVLARAMRGEYEESSLRELPKAWRDAAFERRGDLFVLEPELRRGVVFARADIRDFSPQEPLQLLLCRNSVFTYFDEAEQQRFLERAYDRLLSGGVLVVGSHEIASIARCVQALGAGDRPPRFEPSALPEVYRRLGT